MVTPSATSVPPASQEHLRDLLNLEQCSANHFRSCQNERNLNGRGHVFGGQMLAQAMMAGALTAEGREACALQLTFLRSADALRPIDYEVGILQDGKRYATRRITGRQGERSVVEAIASFRTQSPDDTPWSHSSSPPDVPGPDSLASMSALDIEHRPLLAAHDYHLYERPCLELRLIGAERRLLACAPSPTECWWVRLKHPLPDDSASHRAALAYLSDWWLSAPILAPHLPLVGVRDRVFLASLVHSLWIHRPVRADDWLLFVAESPFVGDGQGFTQARIYDRDRRLLASTAQLCTLAARNATNPAEKPS
jgi:acyl-CoA thioesterase-2